MNTVLSIIVQIRQNSLRIDNNYLIADYILNNINQIENQSIQEISDNCHVSTNTVLRFCQLLGFSTFKRFKNNLIPTINTRKLQLKEKNAKISPEILINEVKKMISKDFNLDQFKMTLDMIVKKINQSKVLHLYGATYPLALGQSLVEDMALLGVQVKIHQSNYAVIDYQDEIGIHLIISYSGRFVEVNREGYKEIVSFSNPTVLVSRIVENVGDVDYLLQLPKTVSSYFDDIILMLIYDYLLVAYCLMNNYD